MRFPLPLFLPFLLILYSSIQPGASSPFHVQFYANESIEDGSQSIIINRPVRSAPDPVTIGGEANNGKDFDKLPLADLEKQLEQANEKLTKLNKNLTDSKSSLQTKQEDVKGKLQKEVDDKREEWKRLDDTAKGMNKELKLATDEYKAASRESEAANRTFAEFETANSDLATATARKNKVDGAEARLPIAQQEQTDCKNKCKPLLSKGTVELNDEVVAAQGVFDDAEKNVREQQTAINTCTSDCSSLELVMATLKEKVGTAKTALEAAKDDVKTLKECPDKQKTLDKEVKDLEDIKKDPDAVTEAQQAFDAAEALTKDAKFVGIEETRNNAIQKLIQTENAKAAAESTAKSPQEVQDAKDAARRAELAFGNAEAAKKKVENEITQLEAAIDELDKFCKVEQAQVDAMTSAFKERSKPKDEGMGTGGMAGIGACVFVVLLIAVVGFVVYSKVYKPRQNAAKDKKETAKETAKANNSSSGDNSGALAPSNHVAIPIDSTPSVPEAAAVAPAAAPAAVPTVPLAASAPPAPPPALPAVPPVLANAIVPRAHDNYPFIEDPQWLSRFRITPVEELKTMDKKQAGVAKYLKEKVPPKTLVWSYEMLAPLMYEIHGEDGNLYKFDEFLNKRLVQDGRSATFQVLIEALTEVEMLNYQSRCNMYFTDEGILVLAACDNKYFFIPDPERYGKSAMTNMKRKTGTNIKDRKSNMESHYRIKREEDRRKVTKVKYGKGMEKQDYKRTRRIEYSDSTKKETKNGRGPSGGGETVDPWRLPAAPKPIVFDYKTWHEVQVIMEAMENDDYDYTNDNDAHTIRLMRETLNNMNPIEVANIMIPFATRVYGNRMKKLLGLEPRRDIRTWTSPVYDEEPEPFSDIEYNEDTIIEPTQYSSSELVRDLIMEDVDTAAEHSCHTCPPPSVQSSVDTAFEHSCRTCSSPSVQSSLSSIATDNDDIYYSGSDASTSEPSDVTQSSMETEMMNALTPEDVHDFEGKFPRFGGGRDNYKKGSPKRRKKDDESSSKSEKSAEMNTQDKKGGKKKEESSDQSDKSDETEAGPELPTSQYGDNNIHDPDRPQIPTHNENFPELRTLTHDENGNARIMFDREDLKAKLKEFIYNVRRKKKNKFDIQFILNLIHFNQLYFASQPKLIKLEVKHRKELVTFGDLHGSPDAMLYHMKEHGEIGSPTWMTKKYLFLGDYVDRGTRSLDLLVMLLIMKLRYPDNVFLLRGNHESLEININYGLKDEIVRKILGNNGEDATCLHYLINYMFSFMQYAAIADDKILFVHGGIPTVKTMYKNLDEFKKAVNSIPNFLWDTNSNELATMLLWGDPVLGLKTGFMKGTRGIGSAFSEAYLFEFLAATGLEHVVRAHELMEYGHEFFAGKRLICIFSAPTYDTTRRHNNYGSTLCIRPNYVAYFVTLISLDPGKFEQYLQLPDEVKTEWLRQNRRGHIDEINMAHLRTNFKNNTTKPARRADAECC